MTDARLQSLRIYRNTDCLEVFDKSIVADAKLIYKKYLRHVAPKEKITPIIAKKNVSIYVSLLNAVVK